MSAEILVVDDELYMLNLTGMILEGEGYSVNKCLSPEDALKIEKVPRLLLTDLQMPEMNGLALIKRLREKFSANIIPCLLMTGANSDHPDVSAFIAAEGRGSWIKKPFELDNLLDCVKRKIA